MQENNGQTSLTKASRERKIMFLMAIAYSANVGGTGTVIGTTPNPILIENLDDFDDHPLNFGSWLVFAFPIVALCTLGTWIWLQWYFLGFPCRKKSTHKDREQEKRANERVRKLLREKYSQLGPMSYYEKSVLGVFIFLALLWFLRSPGFFTGWGDALENLYDDEISIADSTPSILAVLILFMLPAQPYFMSVFSTKV